MTMLLHDLRLALRALRRAPGFTLVALLTLGLGIGATTAIFSVAYGVLLKPLPYPEAERLVQLRRAGGGYESEYLLTYPQFEFLREHGPGLTAAAAATPVGFNIVGQEGAVRATGLRVSHDYFRALGVPPQLGRAFTAEEDQPAGPNAVILSHGFWQRAFGGDPGILGRSVTLDGQPYTVVGVMPAGFQSYPVTEAWSTLAQVAQTVGSGGNLTFHGRLAPGRTLAQVAPQWAPLSQEIRARFPGTLDSLSAVTLTPALEVPTLDLVRPVRLLGGAIGFVLLIACANVTSLVLGRGLARGRELAVRQALGATRAQLVRTLLTESLVLGLAGGALGLLLATWSLGLLVRLLPADLPHAGRIGIDGTVLLFTTGVSLLVGTLVGLIPAWQAGRGARPELLKEGAMRTTSGSAHTRLRDALVVGELALALVLLTGAGLLVQTFANLLRTDPGFDPAPVVATEIWITGTGYGNPVARSAFYERLTAELATLPGVRSAAVVEAGLPLERGGNMPVRQHGEFLGTSIDFRGITPGYVDVLGVPVLEGRGVAAGDVEGAEPVVVVNATFARRLLGGEREALGQVITVGGNANAAARRVVGVVGDVRSFVGSSAPPTVFLPAGQTPEGVTRIFNGWFPIHVLVRTQGAPAALGEAVAAAIRRVDPAVPIGRVRPLPEVLGQSLALPRFLMVMLGGFAGLALLLAMVGIYGLISFLVLQRTREIGVRLALGARPGDVLRLVVGRGLALAGAGVGLGLLAAAGLTRLLTSQLHGVTPLDPASFLLGALALLLVALVASAVPALRAGRIDPNTALRAG